MNEPNATAAESAVLVIDVRQVIEDLQIDEAYVVAPVARRYPLSEGVQVLPVWEVAGVWGGQP